MTSRPGLSGALVGLGFAASVVGLMLLLTPIIGVIARVLSAVPGAVTGCVLVGAGAMMIAVGLRFYNPFARRD